MNVTVHAAETSLATLTADYLPLLLQTAGEVSADFARCQAVPVAAVAEPAGLTPRKVAARHQMVNSRLTTVRMTDLRGRR